MENQFLRTEMLIGEDSVKKLSNSHVAIFGIGGVGSFVAEALARAGVGNLDLIDNDVVNLTNINRQIIALHSTIGKSKVDIMKTRVLDINPDCNVNVCNLFFSKENSYKIDFSQYDYVIDAIDFVKGKVELVIKSQEASVPIISSMGTGNKLYPEKFEITDIYKTSVCPLARAMRTELKKLGIKKLKVLYSKEIPNKNSKIKVPASISFVPSCAGLIIAGAVIRDLIDYENL